jgi:hypothetical protein
MKLGKRRCGFANMQKKKKAKTQTSDKKEEKKETVETKTN